MDCYRVALGIAGARRAMIELRSSYSSERTMELPIPQSSSPHTPASPEFQTLPNTLRV